jgi:hypothetical protein
VDKVGELMKIFSKMVSLISWFRFWNWKNIFLFFPLTRSPTMWVLGDVIGETLKETLEKVRKI